jgi:hypothetical protein
MKLFDAIRSAGKGEIVRTLAEEAGIERGEAEQALRALLPELGRAIRRRGESRPDAPVIDAALRDEGYARYLDDPKALCEPAAAADGERVLAEVLDHGQRRDLVRKVATAIGQSEGAVRTMLPLVATLAMAALGPEIREPSPEIPWYGTRPSDRFGAPLLNALAALFEQDEDKPPKDR